MNATNRTQVVAAFNDGRGFADAQAGLAL
jgi:hypothetical protein